MYFKCEITGKIRSGNLEDLILFAREHLALDEQNMMDWIVIDNQDKSKFSNRLKNNSMPIIHLTNSVPENEAIIYKDYSLGNPHHDNYTLARFVRTDDDDLSRSQWELNHVCYQPPH